MSDGKDVDRAEPKRVEGSEPVPGGFAPERETAAGGSAGRAPGSAGSKTGAGEGERLVIGSEPVPGGFAPELDVRDGKPVDPRDQKERPLRRGSPPDDEV